MTVCWLVALLAGSMSHVPTGSQCRGCGGDVGAANLPPQKVVSAICD